MDILFIHPREIFERNASVNMDHVAEAKNVVKIGWKSIVTWPSAERGRHNFNYCDIVRGYIRQIGAGFTTVIN